MILVGHLRRCGRLSTAQHRPCNECRFVPTYSWPHRIGHHQILCLVDLTPARQTPPHVALNHLYCTSFRDSVLVMGVTRRFRHERGSKEQQKQHVAPGGTLTSDSKFVHTVLYTPIPPPYSSPEARKVAAATAARSGLKDGKALERRAEFR